MIHGKQKQPEFSDGEVYNLLYNLALDNRAEIEHFTDMVIPEGQTLAHLEEAAADPYQEQYLKCFERDDAIAALMGVHKVRLHEFPAFVKNMVTLQRHNVEELAKVLVQANAAQDYLDGLLAADIETQRRELSQFPDFRDMLQGQHHPSMARHLRSDALSDEDPDRDPDEELQDQLEEKSMLADLPN